MADPAVPLMVGQSAQQQTHIIEEGETLGALAQRYYGKASQAGVIYHANNKDVFKWKNPDEVKLQPGQVLTVPINPPTSFLPPTSCNPFANNSTCDNFDLGRIVKGNYWTMPGALK